MRHKLNYSKQEIMNLISEQRMFCGNLKVKVRDPPFPQRVRIMTVVVQIDPTIIQKIKLEDEFDNTVYIPLDSSYKEIRHAAYLLVKKGESYIWNKKI